MYGRTHIATQATVERWLRVHPSIEIVSRDRDSAYAQAVRHAAPLAVQVADRWHLLRSCSDTLRSALAPWDSLLKQTAQARVRELQPAQPATIQPCLMVGPGPVSPAKIEARNRNRERRQARYLEVMERVRQGRSDNRIARELGLDRSTVLRWRLAGEFPERQDIPRPRQVDSYAGYLEQRWDEGCRNGTALWAELLQRGFTGSSDLVRIWIRRYGLQSSRPRLRRPRQRRTSASRWMWLLLNEPAQHRLLLDDLYHQVPELAANAQAAPSSSASCGEETSRPGPVGWNRRGTPHWPASPIISGATRLPCWPRFASPGTTAPSKATSIGLSCSNARCTGARASICCACASSTHTKPHPTVHRLGWSVLHQMCGRAWNADEAPRPTNPQPRRVYLIARRVIFRFLTRQKKRHRHTTNRPSTRGITITPRIKGHFD